MSILNKKQVELNLLELVPASKFLYEEEKNGLVSVIIPRFTNKFLLKIFSRKLKNNPNIKLKLDEFGSAAFREIDGNQNVEKIAEKLVEQFGERIQPVNGRISIYFKQLYDSNIIYFKEL